LEDILANSLMHLSKMRGGALIAASNWRHDQMVNIRCTEAAAPQDGLNLVEYIGTPMLRLILCYEVTETDAELGMKLYGRC
jgi:hypothetical protein